MELLRRENYIYSQIKLLDFENSYEDIDYEAKQKQLERFETALDTITVTTDVYQKRLDIIEVNLNKEIQSQMIKLANLGFVIGICVFNIFTTKVYC